jgi:hypothetical protein
MSFPSLGPDGTNGGPRDLTGWDRLAIGWTLMPGRWRITGGAIKLKHDLASKPGTDGANPKFHGLDPQLFEAEGYLWTDEQMEQLRTVLPGLLPQPGKAIDPVSVAHPDILHLGVAVSMVIVGATSLTREGTARKMKLHMLHWMSGTVPKNQGASRVPTRSLRNARAEAARQQQNPNPLPTQQPGAAGPPTSLAPNR